MIGNDVIDLVATRIQSNWKRKGFLEKLFTLEERELIRNHDSSETMVWVLWSMKEAAYKIYNRETKLRGFIPQQLICSIITDCNSNLEGVVNCNGFVYSTKTIVENDMIHTIATVGIDTIEKVQEITNGDIVKDVLGIPYLSIKDKLYPVSVSHHGRFCKTISLTHC